MKRWLRIILPLLILLAIGVAVYWRYQSAGAAQQTAEPVTAPTTVRVGRGTVQQTVSAPGTLVGTREMALSLPVGGRLATLPVRPGQRVTAGETLATLDTSELAASERHQYRAYLQAQLAYSQTIQPPAPVALAAAQAALISAQSAYTDLIAPPAANELAAVESTLRNAQASLQNAQTLYEISTDRAAATLNLEQAKNNLVAAQAAYDQASAPPSESQRRSAQAQIATAQAQLQQLEPDPDVIARAQLELAQAHAAWQAAVADVESASLLAPFDGIVVEIQPRLGESVPANSLIMLLTDPSALEVQARVIEEDLPLVQIGQAVEIYFDAAPDVLLEGRVDRINPLRLPGDRPLYSVYVTIDKTPPEVLAGMSSDIAIIIARKEDVLYLPRTLVRAGASGNGQVEIWVAGQRQRRQVQVGLRGDVYIEIREGLQEGDEVVSQ